MGTNKRYDVYSAPLAEIAKAAERAPRPISLPDEMVRASGRRRDEPQPVPVKAHVPVQVAYTDVQLVDADALAWTTGGLVLIRYVPEGARAPVYIWVAGNFVHRK